MAELKPCPFCGGWVSVEERLPEPGKTVLVYSVEEGGRGTARLDRDGDWLARDGSAFGVCLEGVTYWQVLPEPPQGGQDAEATATAEAH